MNFKLTEEQIEYKHCLREFINLHINKEKNSFDKKWKLCAEYGIFGIPYEEKYGGLGEDCLTAAILMEELGYACEDAGFVFAITNHLWAGLNSIYRIGNEKQRKYYVCPMIKGEKIGALALTNPDYGSDISITNVIAYKTKNGYILNGSKVYISNGSIADVIIVSARTGDIGKINSISCFICDVKTSGIKIGKEIKKMGLENCPMSEIFFENVFVPNDKVLGGIGSGIRVINKIMQWERCYEFSVQIGIMKRLMEKCIHYSMQRKLIQFQAITHKIAQMRISIELAELLMYKIASLDDQRKDIYLESSIFKYFVSEEYTKLCIETLQIFGAYGYTVESGIEKAVRDALSSKIYAGASEIQLNIIYKLTQNEIVIQERKGKI